MNTGRSTSLIIFAPSGIGEVTPASDLTSMIIDAAAADDHGGLDNGDIVVVTSKIISKHEGRTLPADRRQDAISSEAVRTVAQRGQTRIVQTHHGLTMAAAGVDNSNVEPGTILLLPVDPDASAARLRQEIAERINVRVGVIISDTAGRAWRVGQTDLAIGAAGVRVIDDYEGQQDPYGNDLQVTAMAIADEIASAADLAKSKLGGRPVAVIRGLERFVTADGSGEPATALVRPADEDMFRFGSQEAVVRAVVHALDCPDRYAEIIALPLAEQVSTLQSDPCLVDAPAATRELVEAILRAGRQ